MLKDKIKKLCRENGISVPKLEIELGLSSGSISKWDKSSPKADNLKKVADYFGVTIDYLMSEDKPDMGKFDFQLFGENASPEDQQKELMKKQLLDLYAGMSDEEKKTALAVLEAIATKGK